MARFRHSTAEFQRRPDMTNTPQLLFLPGAGADPRFWRPVGESLPAHWPKHYFGWPGLGRQAAAPTVRGLEDLVSLVATRLGNEPVDLLAQSMGGIIAMMLLLRYPTKIRRLVLSVTSAGVNMARFGATNWQETYHRKNPNAPAWLRDVQADLSTQLRLVTQPVLLLWGDADPISPVAVGRYLETLLPNSELHVLPGGDHDIVHSRAPEVAPLIQRFLESEPY